MADVLQFNNKVPSLKNADAASGEIKAINLSARSDADGVKVEATAEDVGATLGAVGGFLGGLFGKPAQAPIDTNEQAAKEPPQRKPAEKRDWGMTVRAALPFLAAGAAIVSAVAGVVVVLRKRPKKSEAKND